MEKWSNGWLRSPLVVYLVHIACLSLSFPLVEAAYTASLPFCKALVLTFFVKSCDRLLIALSFQWPPLTCTETLWRWYFFPACIGCIVWCPLLAHLVATLEHMCSKAWINWVTVLDWQLACVDPIHSFHPCSLTSCLPHLRTLLFGWCCHGTVWPDRGFTYSILCSLHRGQLTRLRCSDAKHTVYESSGVDWRSGFCNSV